LFRLGPERARCVLVSLFWNIILFLDRQSYKVEKYERAILVGMNQWVDVVLPPA
jgi:hypothetical protein